MDASQPHGGSEQPRGGAGSNERFYADLSGFSDFGQVVDLTGYRPVPDDWVVLISDVTGSTAAIADGRYKDVNMLGAATITAITNACGEADIPYTFGGDGGVVVVPPGAGRRAGSALAALPRTRREPSACTCAPGRWPSPSCAGAGPTFWCASSASVPATAWPCSPVPGSIWPMPC